MPSHQEPEGPALPRWANPARWTKRGQRWGWIALCLLLLVLSPNPWVTAANIAIVYLGWRFIRFCWRAFERQMVKNAEPDDDRYGLLTVEQAAWDDLVARLRDDTDGGSTRVR